MHASPSGQRVTKFTFRAIDSVRLQMSINSFNISVRIVCLFPFAELIAGNPIVLGFPLELVELAFESRETGLESYRLPALSTCDGATVGTDESSLPRTCKEPRGALNAPFEVWILQQCSVSKFPLEELMNRLLQGVLKQNIQV